MLRMVYFRSSRILKKIFLKLPVEYIISELKKNYITHFKNPSVELVNDEFEEIALIKTF